MYPGEHPGTYLGHFGIPASVALLHLAQDVDVQQALHLVAVLEGMPVRALLPLQLGWLPWGQQGQHPQACRVQSHTSASLQGLKININWGRTVQTPLYTLYTP